MTMPGFAITRRGIAGALGKRPSRKQLRTSLLVVTLAAVIAFFAASGLSSATAASGGRGSHKSLSDASITTPDLNVFMQE